MKERRGRWEAETGECVYVNKRHGRIRSRGHPCSRGVWHMRVLAVHLIHLADLHKWRDSADAQKIVQLWNVSTVLVAAEKDPAKQMLKRRKNNVKESTRAKKTLKVDKLKGTRSFCPVGRVCKTTGKQACSGTHTKRTELTSTTANTGLLTSIHG